MDDAAQHRARWSAAHGGQAASSPLVRLWLAGMRRAALPLVRARVPPSAVTLLGLLLSLGALPVAAVGGRATLAVPVLLALAGVLDGVDGAVAVLGGTASARGAVLDAVADRVADAAGLGALWVLGASGRLVAVAVAAGWLAEYARARAQAQGLRGAGTITASERPTRVAVAAMFALGAGLHPAAASTWAQAGALAGAAAGLVGLVHLLIALRRGLGALDRAAAQGAAAEGEAATGADGRR